MNGGGTDRKIDSSRTRAAAIAIQGGGVYGLTLLGQLQSVIEDHGYDPIALAGSSAGAMVATLTWAGYTPDEIKEWIERKADNDGPGLGSLLGPFDDISNLASLRSLQSTLAAALEDLKHPNKKLGIAGWIRLCYRARKAANQVEGLYRKRGVFSGQTLQAEIEALLRARIDVPKSICPDGEPLRFGHVTKLMKDGRLYVPPLLLTTTNLSRRRLQVITSVSDQFANVPIAAAVRASAGFPVFFTPLELPECPGGGWFSDGGLVSNFPIWMFTETLREEIRSSSLAPIYGPIANLPWMRIGLRVVDDEADTNDLRDPWMYFKALAAMLSAGTRNELEERLAENAPRTMIVRQSASTTGGPSGVLDVDEIDSARIAAMISTGRAFGKRYFEGIGSPGTVRSIDRADKSVSNSLQQLVERSALVLGLPLDQLKLRSNVFLPTRVGRITRLRLTFSAYMDGDPDTEMDFPDCWSGATGFCFWTRRPQVCNLAAIAALRDRDMDRYKKLFGMDHSLQQQVKTDRTWLASVPIFDPHELRLDSRRTISARPRHEGYRIVDLETEMDGPVLGVLNLDAGWDYVSVRLDDDPQVHQADQRIQSIVSMMQGTAFRLGALLSSELPN